MKVLPCFTDPEAKKEIERLCAQHRISISLLEELCDTMLQHSGKARITGIDTEISQCLDRFLDRSSNT